MLAPSHYYHSGYFNTGWYSSIDTGDNAMNGLPNWIRQILWISPGKVRTEMTDLHSGPRRVRVQSSGQNYFLSTIRKCTYPVALCLWQCVSGSWRPNTECKLGQPIGLVIFGRIWFPHLDRIPSEEHLDIVCRVSQLSRNCKDRNGKLGNTHADINLWLVHYHTSFTLSVWKK